MIFWGKWHFASLPVAHCSSSCPASVLKVVENNEGGGLNNGAVGVEWKSCLETMEIVGVVAMGEEVSTTEAGTLKMNKQKKLKAYFPFSNRVVYKIEDDRMNRKYFL